MQTGAAPYTIFYDAECRICTAFAHFVKALDLRGRMTAVTIQESEGLLTSIPPPDVLEAMHALGPNGHLSTGGDAMPTILAGLTGGPAFETLVRSSHPAMAGLDGLYRVLVAVRGRLTCGNASPSSARALPP